MAEDFGRDVRNLIASQEYAQIFETRLSEDSQARGRWTTSEGGSYFATGVGGALMGRGAHVLLIDDPFGSMADARSDPQRKATHEWFTGTCYNRLEKGGKIILINHRMHQDDLTGRLLAQQAAGGDKWEVVELKATSPDGAALWPEKFDVAALARIKANTTAQDYAALYMQEPTPESGTYFRDEWLFPYVGDNPPFMNIYGASDFAVTSNGGDWTVHAILGIDPQRRMYLLDLWRAQASSKVWIEAYCDMVLKWKPAWWAMETGQISAGLGPFIIERSRERQAWTNIVKFPTKGDKAVRSQSMRGRMELLGLFVPAAAKWLPDLRAELIAFPQGAHDDAVDSLGLLGQLMDLYSPGIVEKKDDTEKWPGYAVKGGNEDKLSFMTL